MNALATSPAPAGALTVHQPNGLPVWMAGITGALEHAMPVAKMLAASGMVPKAYENKPEAIIVAGAMGARLGLDLFSALAGIAVINGRPTIWGDAMLAVCQNHPAFEDLIESYEGDPKTDTYTAVCTVRRKGREPYTQRFSFMDARVAGLWGKQGPWTTAPQRMIQMRARAFALRGAFADTLAGFHSREEIEDLIDVTESAHVRDGVPDPVSAKRRVVKEARTTDKTNESNAAPAAAELPASPGQGEGDSAKPDGTAPAAGEKAAEKAPEQAVPTYPVEQLHNAVVALFRKGDAGKAKSKEIMEKWKLKQVSEMGGASPADRKAFLDEVLAATAALGGAA